MYIVLKNISLSTISQLSTKEVGNFLVLMLQRRFSKERTQPRPPLPSPPLLDTSALGSTLLVLSSLRAWSIHQFFVQKQKLKIDRSIQFLNFFRNSRHSSGQMTGETIFLRIAKICLQGKTLKQLWNLFRHCAGRKKLENQKLTSIFNFQFWIEN